MFHDKQLIWSIELCAGREFPNRSFMLVMRLLGLRWQGLPAAVLLPTMLTAALFLGPLALMALRWRSDAACTPQLDRALLQVRW